MIVKLKAASNRARTIFEIQSSFPLIKKQNYYVNTIEPKLSFRINPSDMNKYTNETRRIDADNIFNIDRLGIGNMKRVNH